LFQKPTHIRYKIIGCLIAVVGVVSACTRWYGIDDRSLVIIGELPSKYKGSILLKFSDSLMSHKYTIPEKYLDKFSEESDSTSKTKRFYYFGGLKEEIYAIDYEFEGVEFSSFFNPKMSANWLAKKDMDSLERMRVIKKFTDSILLPLENKIDADSAYLRFMRK
jgi:hypothetical protein